MSRLGAKVMRARKSVHRKALALLADDWEEATKPTDRTPPTQVPASQERRGRLLLLGLLLVACGLWWALALFEVLR